MCETAKAFHLTKAHPVYVVSGIFFAPDTEMVFVLNTDNNETLFALHLGPFTLVLIKQTHKKML